MPERSNWRKKSGCAVWVNDRGWGVRREVGTRDNQWVYVVVAPYPFGVPEVLAGGWCSLMGLMRRVDDYCRVINA